MLLDFRAAWCSPCCREIPYLRRTYAVYKESGFEIYAVSPENDIAGWQAFTADNDTPRINVPGVDTDKTSPAAALYDTASIPANFLISPAGIIVAKNLRGAEPEKKLAGATRPT